MTTKILLNILFFVLVILKLNFVNCGSGRHGKEKEPLLTKSTSIDSASSSNIINSPRRGNLERSQTGPPSLDEFKNDFLINSPIRNSPRHPILPRYPSETGNEAFYKCFELCGKVTKCLNECFGGPESFKTDKEINSELEQQRSDLDEYLSERREKVKRKNKNKNSEEST
ncbi:hypothetical protein Mgra_00008028 [Meloidogyne graminicola]|uniref:Uncharacterized protein n=1 Tax=Meloidogyne graminicola TaxID=189291 RepID=A0A8S9ZH64_9BILA|nr:hypothetical protein Mgra_00008028 [Meloidogyne graminicola]